MCPMYTCSCCNRTHAMQIYRKVNPLSEDENFSPSCLAHVHKLLCRLCDPEVGVGIKRTVCTSMCDAFYDECSDEFFGYETISGPLVPCGDSTGTALCFRLGEVAKTGRDACGLMGIAVETDGEGPCFDGHVSTSTQLCRQSTTTRGRKQTSDSESGDKQSGMASWKLLLIALLIYLLAKRYFNPRGRQVPHVPRPGTAPTREQLLRGRGG